MRLNLRAMIGLRPKIFISAMLMGASLLEASSTRYNPSGAKHEANILYQAARKAEAAGDRLNALLLYTRADALQPSNAEFALQRGALQDQLSRTASFMQVAPANQPVVPAAAIDAADPDPQLQMQSNAGDAATRAAFRIATERISPSEAIEGEAALPPLKLKDTGERKSFDLRGTVRPMMEEVAKAFGVRLDFDPAYQAGTQPVTLHVNDVTMAEAFHILEAASNSFFVPVGDHEALVFRETQQNRTSNAAVMSVAIPIPDRMSVQDAQDIASGVQQTMEMRRIAVDAGRRTIFLRDQESKIIAARKIISDLARFRAEVQIDVELISVAKSSSLSYGLSLPTSLPIVNFSSVLRNIPAAIAGVTSFATFGGGATLLGMGIADASAFATVSRSESESILTSRAVTVDGQPVTLHIGDRYPIATSIYTDSTSAANTIPSLTYVDLGLKIQMTPVVHEGEMSLTVEAEYSVLGTSTSNTNPVISTRKLQGTTRVAFGEYTVIAGLATANVSNQTSGIPFLSTIPGIGRLFRSNVKSKDSSEVLIVLKPHLLSDPPWARPPSAIWTGTETVPAAVY